MERELFSEFYFGNINGEAIRAGKKLQANDPQFGDFIFTTAKQDANKAGTTRREENNMVVNFSQLTRPVSSTDVPFYDANIENDLRDSSTSMDSMDFQGKEKAFFETEQSSRNKRKGRDASELNYQSKRDEEEENGSDARKNRATSSSRRSRSAEMHNLSERRRRDKINEKLKALQELLPHCTKTDKASMLDEAIEYLKSLQIQLQMMWVESGMAPMLFSENQHYMSIMAMDHHHHHHHANSLPYPRVTRPLFDDQLRGLDANPQHVNSASQTQNLYLHKFSTQGSTQRGFGERTVQEPRFGDGLVIDRSSFL